MRNCLNQVLPDDNVPVAASIESRDMATLERTVDAISAGWVYVEQIDPQVTQAPGAGAGALRPEWINDRSALLVGLSTARGWNLGNARLTLLPDEMGAATGWETRRWSHSDADEGTVFSSAPDGAKLRQMEAPPQSFAHFGSNDAELALRRSAC